MLKTCPAQYLDVELAQFDLSVRTANCFKALGVTKLKELVPITEKELLKTKNFGRTSLAEVRQLLDSLGLFLGMSDENIASLSEQPQSKIVSEAAESHDCERLLLASPWMAAVAQKFFMEYLKNQLATVEDSMSVRQSVRPNVLVSDALVSMGFKFFGLIYDEVYSTLSEREREIVTFRTHTFEPSTLEELAYLYDITRERIRQIEMKLEVTFTKFVSKTQVQIQIESFSDSLKKVVRLEKARQIAAPLISQSEYQKQALSALLQYSGPYFISGRWLVRKDVSEEVDNIRSRLIENADRLGRIPEAIIESETQGLFESREDRDAFLAEIVSLPQIDGQFVISDTGLRRILLAMERIGRPATKEEIAEIVGVDDPSRIASQFGRADFIVRADKHRWAFKEWVEDPYDGIVGEIEQRIDEGGGQCSVARLLEEIPSQFGVSVLSVRAYLDTPLFVVSNGTARRATKDEIASTWFGNPEDVPNAVRLNDGAWAVRIPVEERFFSGYSASIPAAVIAECGLSLGESLTVPVEGTNLAVSLIWRASSTIKTADLGRIEPVLTALDISPGEEVLVAPSRDLVRIFRCNAAPISQENIEVPTEEKNIDDSILDDLFGR